MLVKIEEKPFAAGAMRECFAMKKLTSMHGQWIKAGNYVAKRYKAPCPRCPHTLLPLLLPMTRPCHCDPSMHTRSE